MYLSLASVSKLLATVGVGSKDASTLLDGLTADQPERELVRELNRRVGLLLAVRAEVLRRALLAFPDLTPKEWLHAQHSPHVFGDEDVFARAFAVAVAATGEFSDVALVDADTGKRLANVRGLKAGATGVQSRAIAGHV